MKKRFPSIMTGVMLSLVSGLSFCAIVELCFQVGESAPEIRFDLRKSPTPFILGVGESTMLAEPYDSVTSLAHLTQYYLQSMYPGRKIPVSLIAKGGATLTRLLPSVLDELKKMPALVIVYVGHNNFLGAFNHNQVCTERSSFFYKIFHWSKLYRYLLGRIQRKGIEKDPKIGIRGLFDLPIVCEEQKNQVLEDFRRSIYSLAANCQARGIPLVIFLPSGNEVGFNPNRSFYSGSENKKNLLRDYIFRARCALSESRYEDALKDLIAAEEIDSHFAETWYETGQAYLGLGNLEKADYAFHRAKEEDAFPWRALDEQLNAIREVENKYGVVLVDTRTLLKNASSTGLLDSSVFHDNAHLTFVGYMALAKGAAEIIASHNLLDWGKVYRNITPDPREVLKQIGWTDKSLEAFLISQSRMYDRISNITFDSLPRLKLLFGYVKSLSKFGNRLPNGISSLQTIKNRYLVDRNIATNCPKNNLEDVEAPTALDRWPYLVPTIDD